MSLFTIADLHLSLGTDKPMDVFSGWENYTNRIAENWQKTVRKDDTVVIAGDVSWGITLNESLADLRFIDSLNGNKILIKGNHDYWWSTGSKIKSFFEANNIFTISILHNNCYSDGKYALCGTRGWVYDGVGEKDQKVINRECGRLERSIECAYHSGVKPVVFLHYPPVYGDFVCYEIISVLKKYGINKVFYGHIHGSGIHNTVAEYDGISLKLLSADNLGFKPSLVGKCGIFTVLK